MSAHFGMPVPQLLRKLRGRSAAEFRVRGLQLARVWMERTGLSPDAVAPSPERIWRRLSPASRGAVNDSADRLLENFRQTGATRLWPGLTDRAATVAELRRRWPTAERRIVEQAEQLAEGRFDLLGYKNLSFGDPIDWHRDPVAGRSAPRRHWSTIPYLDARVVGDHKVVWELNRHQHFVTLGQAYWLTNDERFARTLISQLTAWMDANPPKVGVNWASSLEVSYRAISWLWALGFLRESPSLSPSIYLRVLGFLDVHARHVESFLSTFFSPNTHLTGEALGLFAIGSCLPELSGSDRWRRIGAGVLGDEIVRQVRPDGVYVEQSSHYHRYTIEIYLSALALARRTGQALPVREDRIEAALDHAMFLTMPNGEFPLIGDDDGGRLLPFDAAALNDFRPALATGAAIFERSDYAAVAGGASEQCLWLLGTSGVQKVDRMERTPPREVSRAFPEGGFYVTRDDWSSSSNYLVVDCGPHGYLSAGHAHADALGFVLCVSGQPCLIDPGTHAYCGASEDRNRFRGSAAHNTLTLDDASSSEPDDAPFRWISMAASSVRRWRCTDDAVFLDAVAEGFEELDADACHERTFLYLPGQYWVLHDRILADGNHGFALHFHCAPELNAIVDSSHAITVQRSESGDPMLHLVTFAATGSYEIVDDFVAPQYGRKVPSKTCVFRARMRGVADVFTFLVPGGELPPVIRRIGEDTFAIARNGTRDTLRVVRGDDESLSTWTLTRSDSATGKVLSEISIDGGVMPPSAPTASRAERDHAMSGGAD